jgi:hypothetical protein
MGRVLPRIVSYANVFPKFRFDGDLVQVPAKAGQPYGLFGVYFLSNIFFVHASLFCVFTFWTVAFTGKKCSKLRETFIERTAMDTFFFFFFTLSFPIAMYVDCFGTALSFMIKVNCRYKKICVGGS